MAITKEMKINAARGLRLHQLTGKGDTSVAKHIVAGTKRKRTRKALCKFFAETPAPKSTTERIAWLLHGGDAGKVWLGDDATPTYKATAIKTDTNLGIVFGYAIVCKKEGEPYVDLQDDYIPEDVMLKAAADFMTGDRVAKDSHAGENIGQVVFGFPLTSEIAKAFELDPKATGFLVGMKPGADDILKAYADGEYTGFSLGGSNVVTSEM